MAAAAVFRVKELRELILVHTAASPFELARWRRVCRAWRDSAALDSQNCEDIVQEVSFLLDRCILRAFIFEEVQETASDWVCRRCGAVVKDASASCLTCDPHDRRVLLVPADLPVSERRSYIDWVKDRGEWRALRNDGYYDHAWRQHPFPSSRAQ